MDAVMFRRIFLTVFFLFPLAVFAQTYDYNAIHFASNSYGCIVGNKGLILITTDGGITWREVKTLGTGRTQDLYAVHFIADGIGLVGGAGHRLYVTIDGCANWTPLQVAPFPEITPDYQIMKIHFPDPFQGWLMIIDTVGGNRAGRVYHSTNSGGYWAKEKEISRGIFTGMSFQESSDRGVVVSDTLIGVLYNSGSVWLTPDGFQFPPQPFYSRQVLNGVYYAPATSEAPSAVYACGYANGALAEPTLFLKSDDGGRNWSLLVQRAQDINYGQAKKMYFADPNNGIVIGTTKNGSYIARTTDGEHFSPIFFEHEKKTTLRDVFGSAANLWVVGSNCFLAQSTDFGTTWKVISLCPTNDVERTREPLSFELEQNFPNPATAADATTIRFRFLSRHAGVNKTEHLTLRLYNALGELVATPIDGMYDPGEYSTVVQTASLPTGVYLYRLTAGDLSVAKRMMIVR